MIRPEIDSDRLSNADSVTDVQLAHEFIVEYDSPKGPVNGACECGGWYCSAYSQDGIEPAAEALKTMYDSHVASSSAVESDEDNS